MRWRPGYFNGYQHDSVQTSMSIAKSVLSALVGIAVGEGRIGSVDDSITRYVPELAISRRGHPDRPGRRHTAAAGRGNFRVSRGGGWLAW